MQNRKTVSILVSFGVFLMITVLGAGFASGTTYYVRPDGGSADQCTGTTDAPYPGSGLGQPCAWSHLFWAIQVLNDQPEWRLKSGDMLVIHQGSYRMGYGAPNTEWCFQEGAYDCVLPSVPSGVSIVGYGWDAGCTNPPELWSTGRAWYIFRLEGSSNVTIACLELTDHSGCVYEHSNPSVRCNYSDPPYGDWGYSGIWASDASNVTLKDLNIHGFGSEGIMAGRISNWHIENVRIAGNGWSGWNGDLWGEDSSNSGTIYFKNLIVEWNGCAETYPGKQPDHCWAQSAGGYGDGMGTAATGGNWIFEDSIFRYNTSDGLDLLYVGLNANHQVVESSVTLNRVQAYGNAGNQIKVAGPSQIINSLIIGNCNYFWGKSFAQEMGDVNSGDSCRAGGAAISISFYPGNQSYVINNTVASEGWAITEAKCRNEEVPEAPACNGQERLYIVNNNLIAYPNVTSPGDWPDLVGDGDPGHFTRAETVDYNILYQVQYDNMAAMGSHNIQANPQIANDSLDNFDGHLTASSPAIDAGLNVGGLGGLIPSIDIEGNVRPVGSGVDIGAYEYTTEPVDPFVRRVQEAYVAYYGRCADPGGLDFWVEELRDHNGDLQSIIDAFGNSQEFIDQYGGLSDVELINTIYRQMFNRDPDPAGRDFYLEQLQNGSMTLPTITLNMLDGATGSDRTIVDNKVQVALYATERIRSHNCSYTSADLPQVKAIFASIGADIASVNSAIAAIDAWCN